MADINERVYNLIQADSELKKRHTEILINEKLNLLKQLDVQLDHIETVQVPQIKLRQSTIEKEIGDLKAIEVK